MSEIHNCPKCQAECWRESADVGVGVIYGPWGCPECGWSDSKEFDISEGPKKTNLGGTIDQFGGITPSLRPADSQSAVVPNASEEEG